MKASIAHGVRPSSLILGRDSRRRWGKWDIVLAKAYQRYLAELCPQCGLPKYICHTDDNRIQFKVARDQCASAAVAEKAQHDASKRTHPEFGVRMYGEPFLTPDAVEAGMEFSDFRRPYMIDQARRRGLLPEEQVSETEG